MIWVAAAKAKGYRHPWDSTMFFWCFFAKFLGLALKGICVIFPILVFSLKVWSRGFHYSLLKARHSQKRTESGSRSEGPPGWWLYVIICGCFCCCVRPPNLFLPCRCSSFLFWKPGWNSNCNISAIEGDEGHEGNEGVDSHKSFWIHLKSFSLDFILGWRRLNALRGSNLLSGLRSTLKPSTPEGAHAWVRKELDLKKSLTWKNLWKVFIGSLWWHSGGQDLNKGITVFYNLQFVLTVDKYSMTIEYYIDIVCYRYRII